MKIVISGSNGFIGKKLVRDIKNALPNITIIEIDRRSAINVLDIEQLNTIDSFDLVVHLAAKTYVPDSFIDPYTFYHTNILSTLNFLELCRKRRAKLIYISSYVYGLPNYLPVDENHPSKAFNPYGQSKLICENLCEGYNRDFGVPVIVFRPFNVYGDGQNKDFLIPSIFEQIKNGSSDILLKDPDPKRDFVHVKDVVGAIIKAIEKDFNDFQTLNICSGESYSVEEITIIVNKYLKKKVLFKFNTSTKRKNEVNDTKGDRKKIENYLNWVPSLKLEEGIRLLVNEYNL